MRIEDVFSQEIREKYEFFEYNHALAILFQDFPDELAELKHVLENVGKREQEGPMQARKEPRRGRLPSAVWEMACGSM